MSKKIFFILILFIFIGLFLHFFKINNTPPCLNADELAFSYNSYSLLKTGKDEFGEMLPLRLTSFGDYKLPFLSYLNLPFMAFFGLEKTTSLKLANAFVLVFYPFILYLFVKELFGNIKIALVSSFLFSTSWLIHSFSRQLHEALLTSFLITCAGYLFLLTIKKRKIIFDVFFNVFLLLALLTYHSSRIFAVFFLFYKIILFLKKRINYHYLIITCLVIFIFFLTDIFYKPTRIKNLLFFNNKGLTYKIDELRKNGGPRFFYNKLTISFKDLSSEYLKYFSPQFLVVDGDNNPRFGNPGLSPLTLIEYLFFFIGLYYLFYKKEKNKFFLTFLLLISPLAGSLTWAGLSVSRSFFMFIVLFIIISYGWINFWHKKSSYWFLLIKMAIIGVFLFLTSLNWDYYLNHYPKKWLNQQAWQCGYKELVSYVKKNYSNFHLFYITKESGPPYIFFLYYLKYPPEKFQKEAFLGEVDQYDFQQVEKFDKFIFSLDYDQNKKNMMIVGRPYQVPESGTKKIYFNDQEIFWIKEVK